MKGVHRENREGGGVGIYSVLYIYDEPDVCSTPPSSRPDGILCVV
jgi:hypothetical protein